MRALVPRLLLLLCGALASPVVRTAVIEPLEATSSPQSGHAYRFKLRDPQSLTQAYRHGPYKIVLQGAAAMEDGSTVARGVTDSAGRTAVLRTRQPLQDDQWQVVPVVGRGENGQSFGFVAEGSGDSIAALPYIIDVKDGDLFCGYTDEQGSTVEMRSVVSTTIAAAPVSGGIGECPRLRREVGRAMKERSASQTARALEALAVRWGRKDAGYGQVLRGKAQGVMLRRGSTAEIRALLARELAQVPESGPEATANVYNTIGYALVDQHPPRQLALAHSILQQAVALVPESPHMLDSVAWALHLLGRHAEALTQIDASIMAFARACDPDDLSHRQIAYGHRGSILWALGRRDEALDHWALASQAGRDGSWSAGLDGELVNVHVARRAEGRPATDLCAAAAAG